MKIESDKGYCFPEDKTQIEVYRTSHLAQLDGSIEGCRIIEIEPLNDEYVAVKLYKRVPRCL